MFAKEYVPSTTLFSARMRHTVYLLLLLTSCSSAYSRQADKTLLDFLEDGKTTKEMVILKLGALRYVNWHDTPEGKNILFYRLGKTAEGYFVFSQIKEWGLPEGVALLLRVEGPFSLVLVFDENAVLKKHALVQIQ